MDELNAARKAPFTKEPRALIYLGIYNVSPVLAAACEALGVPRSSAEDIDERSAFPWTVGRLQRNPESLGRTAFNDLLREAQNEGEAWLVDRGLLEKPMEHADLATFETFLRESAGCAEACPDELARILVRPGEFLSRGS